MGLGEHGHHTPAELSGGQQQRVSIARAIIAKPPILFADEPTGNLDSHTAAQIMDILRVIVNTEGATLVLVTHDIDKTNMRTGWCTWLTERSRKFKNRRNRK